MALLLWAVINPIGFKITLLWLLYSLVCILEQLHHVLNFESHGSLYCSGLGNLIFLPGCLSCCFFGGLLSVYQLPEVPLDWWKKILSASASASASVIGTSFSPLLEHWCQRCPCSMRMPSPVVNSICCAAPIPTPLHPISQLWMLLPEG